MINVNTGNEIHNLHLKLPLFKTSSSLATGQGTVSTNYGKTQL